MRSLLVLVATCGLTVLASCGAADEQEPDAGPTEEVGVVDRVETDDLPSPCDLVPLEAMAQVEEAGVSLAPSPGLMTDAEDLLSCSLGQGAPQIGFTGIDADQSLEEFLEESESGEPLDDVGDEALRVEGSAEPTVLARAGDTVVRVEAGPAGDLSEDALVEFTAAVAEQAADQGPPEPIDLPEECPEVTSEPLVAETGEVSLARGHASEDDTLSCDYAGAQRSLRFQVFSDTPAESIASFEGIEPFEVTEDGTELYATSSEIITALVDERCTFRLATRAMPWSLEEERSSEETRAALVDLADWVQEESGCRS